MVKKQGKTAYRNLIILLWLVAFVVTWVTFNDPDYFKGSIGYFMMIGLSIMMVNTHQRRGKFF